MKSSFNIRRMGWLSRWMMATDMPYYRKSAATTLAIVIFLSLIPNMTYIFGGEMDADFVGAVMTVMLAATLLAGGSYMMYSYYQWKDGLRELSLLPASNQEKFFLRYLLSFLSHLAIIIGAILIGDVLQYAVGWVIGRDDLTLATATVCDVMSRFSGSASSKGCFILTLFLWVHTFYMVGANFFRNIKFGWLFTTIILFFLFFAVTHLPDCCHFIDSDEGVLKFISSHTWQLILVLAALIVFHVLLAYRLFCRRQLIGRFFNWI